VLIYMSMGVEGIVAMQACARIGAIHSVVFGGFSAQSVRDRINDAGAVAVITADEQCRGGKKIPLKPAVDEGYRARWLRVDQGRDRFPAHRGCLQHGCRP
jgi:acetyl-CoA synthetase